MCAAHMGSAHCGSQVSALQMSDLALTAAALGQPQSCVLAWTWALAALLAAYQCSHASIIVQAPSFPCKDSDRWLCTSCGRDKVTAAASAHLLIDRMICELVRASRCWRTAIDNLASIRTVDTLFCVQVQLALCLPYDQEQSFGGTTHADASRP